MIGQESVNGTRFDPGLSRRNPAFHYLYSIQGFPVNCPFVTAGETASHREYVLSYQPIDQLEQHRSTQGVGSVPIIYFHILMSSAATVNDPEGACEQVIFRYDRESDLLSPSVLIHPLI